MKIWIKASALRGTSEHLLWRGAIYGLTQLRKLEHQFYYPGDKLTELQLDIVNNEQLIPDVFLKEEANAIVEVDDNRLKLIYRVNSPEFFEDWIDISCAICYPKRTAHHVRNTAETKINVEINLDGTGQADIETGLGFLDHMLEQIAKHGLIDLTLHCNGDLQVDEHHTIEDAAIALGTAITKALGDKRGIDRYGFALPMDESKATVLLDLSGRPFLKFEGEFNRVKVGDFPTEMAEHFFYSLAINLKATLHISVEGENDHHKIEACFKSFAHCLQAAINRNENNLNILPSTKNLL